MRALASILVLALLPSAPGCTGDDASPEPDTAQTVGVCTPLAEGGEGSTRLYLQGAGGQPNAQGRYPLLDDRRDVLGGDHFIMSSGSFVEFTLPAGLALGTTIKVHIARDDTSGVIARYELVALRDGVEVALGALDDGERGNKGRTPFDGAIETSAPLGCADELLLRVSNVTGGTLGIVVVPPDYYSWIEVDVLPPGQGHPSP